MKRRTKKSALIWFSKYNLNVSTHSQRSIFTWAFLSYRRFFSSRLLKFFLCRYWRFLPCVFDVALRACVAINVDVFVSVIMCVCALFGIVEHSTLSPVRMDGDIPAEMRGGEGSSKGASRWPGRIWTGKKKMCIRSHCASNVITGSDSSMWQAALPICQSEIGRVTNGYHCFFPQPPPPPPPTLMSVSFSSAGGEEWPKPGR